MRINQSRRQTFADCARKYWLEYGPHPGAEFGLRTKRTSLPLRIGSAAHKWLESWNTNIDMPTHERLVEAEKACEESFVSSRAPVLMPGEADQEANYVLEILDMMRKYMNRWGTSETFTVLQPEVHGIVKLGPDHEFAFMCDAIVSMNDRLWLQEHKTTWQFGEKWLRSFDLNHQLISYVYGATLILGRVISGILLNAIRKPQRRQGKLTEPDFHRDTIIVIPEQTEAMLQSFYYDASDIASRDITDPRHWPQDTKRCQDYGGCPFWEICAHGTPAEVNEIYVPRRRDYVELPELMEQGIRDEPHPVE